MAITSGQMLFALTIMPRLVLGWALIYNSYLNSMQLYHTLF